MANTRTPPPIIQRAPIIVGTVVQGSLAAAQPTNVPSAPVGNY